MGSAFLAVAGVTWWRGHGAVAGLLATLGGVLSVAGILIPSRLGPVYRAWMVLALTISKVTTPVFLGVVYFLVVTPIGLAMRLFRRNPLTRKLQCGSYWVARSGESDRRGTMKDQF